MFRIAFTRRRKPSADNGPVARREFFDQAWPLTKYLSVEAKGMTFFVSTNDRLGRGLFIRRSIKDFSELDRAVRLLRERGLFRPGSTFVDVGANIGTTTARAIHRHGFAHAIALEPEPQNFRTLRLNMVANEIESLVTALQVAASDGNGDVELAVSARSSGGHVLVRLQPEAATTKTLTVPATTLDELVHGGVIEPDAVGLLWIDTAGAEILALEGASALLERGVPVVTALRPSLPDWPRTKESLSRLLSHYTEFDDIRHGKPAADDLDLMLDSLTEHGDLLACRS